MSQHYSDPTRESDPHALPDVEVFYVSAAQCELNKRTIEADIRAGLEHDYNAYEVGWYYWFCFPGCLPDSDPIGPFASEAEAVSDAQENS